MALEVHQLKYSKEGNHAVNFLITVNPRCGGVVRVKLEVNCEAAENPIMETVFKDVEHGHSCGREAMHEKGFILTFQVVGNNHTSADLLIQS